MRSGFQCCLSLLVLVTIGIPCTARAENPKALLDQGNRLFAEGEYKAAFEVFKKGYELQPTPVFLRSMAYSKLKSFQHEEARKFLEEYKQKFPKAPDIKRITEISAGLEVVVETRVTLRSRPNGADLYFDTEAGGKVGQTEFSGTIEPGKHTIILKAPGYLMTTRVFEIKPKESLTFDIAMKVPFKLTSEPAGATLQIDSDKAASSGTTPFEGGIEPGKRTLILKAPGYRTLTRSVKVPEAAPLELSVTLNVGLKVASIPPKAKVKIDGKEGGVTPADLEASPGKHTLVVSKTGYIASTREVVLDPGKESEIMVELSGGLLSMRTDLPGASVTVGSDDLGQTPVEKKTVPIGQQPVKVAHPDRRAWSGTLRFGQDEVLTAKLKMGRRLWPVWVAVGLAVAGLAAGTATGLIASSNVSEAQDNDYCDGANHPTAAGEAAGASCSYALHHASTASFAVGGAAAAAALIYYLVWGRHSIKVSRSSVKTASSSIRH